MTGDGEVLAVGDFNSDKIQDLAVYAMGPAQPVVEIFLGGGTNGRGDGTFSRHSTEVVGIATDLRALDLNQDGILDLVVVNNWLDSLGILMGNGSNGRGDGTFAAMTEYDTGASPMTMTSGDFNTDGIIDLAVLNVGPDTVSIKLGELAGIGR